MRIKKTSNCKQKSVLFLNLKILANLYKVFNKIIKRNKSLFGYADPRRDGTVRGN